ncbi:MAG: DUF721 domain-containing protein [Alphaproteobacteria bacterium]
MRETRRRGRMRALGATVAKVAAPVFRRRGFAEAGILTDWPHIVGAQLAAHSSPQRLAFERGKRVDGTLHLLVSGAWAPELQHLAPQVIERINGYFGYRAVARIALNQGPLPDTAGAGASTKPAEPRALPQGDAGQVPDEELAKVEDAELRAALKELGAAVRGIPGPAKVP